jgi:hypothetical protein
MSEDPELDAKIQDCCAMGDRLARDTAQEICKRKEALLKAALEYNAFAGQFNQEAVAIDFKTGLHGPFCRISLAEPVMFLDTAADPDEEEHEAH